MSAAFRVFVNERAIEVSPGADVLTAVGAFDAELAARVRAKQAYVTDARGIRMASDVLLGPGAILRVLPVRQREEDDADA